MIVEAKAPGEDLLEALRECRLYATELNASFASGINPCTHVLASNGEETVAGLWDDERALHSLKLSDFAPGNAKFHNLVKFVSRDRMADLATDLSRKIKGRTKFFKPVHLLGGRTTRGGSVGENSFGVNLALEYKYLFNPTTEEERKLVVENAYVRSMKRESHVQPIDRIIRRAAGASTEEGQIIQDTSRPTEVLQRLSDSGKYVHELCLLIGSVGAGKSTFVDYLKEMALDRDIRDSTAWITINLNLAPISKDLIYTWTLDCLIERLRAEHRDYDFDSLSFLQSVFSPHLLRWAKGPASLYSVDSEKYKDLLYQEISRLSQDKATLVAALFQHFFASRSIVPIVVLDNCDKRERDSQLLMFDVANWIKSSFHCMVFLPLREVTFDQFHHEPPLDTVISDLVFRIDAPLLEKVIYERFRWALREISKNQGNFHYYISNGMRIECKRSDVSSYLKAMLTSLFQNHFSKRLIVGLAGRNIRKGIEIFLEFCKSGYIQEDDILRIRNTEGSYSIPPHVVTLIMLKGRRLFYEDPHSRIKNLFHSDRDDAPPDPFVRVAILRWLNDRSSLPGPSGARGYQKAIDLVSDMKAIGHNESRILEELNELLSAECVNSESQATTLTDLEELVSISSAGILHLDLLRDIAYLAIVSEDTWIRNIDIAKKIADNLTGRGRFSSSSRQSTVENALSLVDYLEDYGDHYVPKPSSYLDDIPICQYADHSDLFRYVHEVASMDKGYVDYAELQKLYRPGLEIEAQVSSTQQIGVFVEFGLNGVGLAATGRLRGRSLTDYEQGDSLKVRILSFNQQHKKFEVDIVDE